ncbi:MAG: hypothetical protein WBB28_01835 [Crinalium sp.]
MNSYETRVLRLSKELKESSDRFGQAVRLLTLEPVSFVIIKQSYKALKKATT